MSSKRFLHTFERPATSSAGYPNMTVMRDAIAASMVLAARFELKNKHPE